MADHRTVVTPSDFGALVERVAALEKTSEQNKAGIEHIMQNTDEMVRAFKAARGAFDVLQTIGRIAKPILWVMALVGAIGAAIKFGEWPRS